MKTTSVCLCIILTIALRVVEGSHTVQYVCYIMDGERSSGRRQVSDSPPSLSFGTENGCISDTYWLDIIGARGTGQHGSLNCPMSVVAYGDRGTSEIFLFLAGRRYTVKLRRDTFGTFDFVQIKHLTSNPVCSWFPSAVELSSSDKSIRTSLECSTSRSVFRRRRAISRSLDVTVVTVDQFWAGTGAKIYLKIFGKKGSSGDIRLYGEFVVGGTNSDNTVSIGEIGIITKIRLRHDNTGSSPGWKPDYVRMTEAGEGTYTFEFKEWIESPNPSMDRNIKTVVCTDMDYCASQRCVTCDSCYESDGTYFYGLRSDRKECFRCSHIDKCDVEDCPSTDGQTCSRCEGVVTDSPGLRAYIPAVDKKSCLKACSWRSDSKWCYPGACENELVTNCQCAEGFTGDNCDSIAEKPTILWNYLLFSRTEADTAEAPLDPNTVTEQEKSWTNLKDIQKVKVDFKSKYIPSGIVPAKPPYIEDYKVGISAGTIIFRFFRDDAEVTSSKASLDCGGASKSSPHQGLYNCLQEYSISGLVSTPLQSGDVLQFEFVAENGGTVGVRDKETNDLTSHLYTGLTASAVVKMGIDYVDPYHCTETSCSDSMLTVIDITLEATVTVSWKGWLDDLSGLHHYGIMVFEMEYIVGDGGLRNKRLELMQEYNGTVKSADITFGEKGIFSVELAAYDKAGNYRNSRRIVIYDKESEVTTVPGTVLRVTSAAVTSSYEWQWTADSVTVDWDLHYINILHDDKKFLAVVTSAPDVDSLYDDNGHSRGIDAIQNVQGIVEYKTAFKTDHAGGNTITTTPADGDFTSRSQDQNHIFNPTLVDGDTLRYWIRAYDIRGEYLEESVVVHIDTSPPVIRNLWLTRGDRLNIGVHGLEELSTMTIEWESYDDHSGLETVSWRLFDNITSSDIVHGVQHLTAQGDATDVSACNAKYGSYPRGSNCYCTPGNGCYHRHYQVKPIVVLDSIGHGGMLQSRERGVHDVDYFLEVTVMNHAHLTSKLDFKVTVDASPPHPGVVHDGQAEKPEVDYQSTLQLHAHWEGFFDKESGVKFYQYGFDDHCLKESDFALDLTTVQVKETFSTHASWTATAPGKFYITVVAYNRALEPSSPVCSDGVTIDQTKPVLSQIAVLHSRTTEGLVKTAGGEVWFINSDRRRSKVEDPDNTCLQNSFSITDDELRLLPMHLSADGKNIIHVSSVCTRYKAFCLSGVNTFYINRDQSLYANWTGTDDDSGIYDFELGVMTDPSRVTAPDIVPFTSTHHHDHYQGYHPRLSEGEQFYIAVKAINRAGLMTVEILGPVIVHTRPPSLTGSVSVSRQGSDLTAKWTTPIFADPEEHYLHYEFAIGSSPGGTEVLPFRPIQTGESCFASTPPSCTAVNITELHWDLHHSHTYYVAIKATNIVGLFTIGVSSPYRHDVRVPSPGSVMDVCPKEERHLFDITEFEDSDFQLSTTTLDARWYGFDDSLSGVTYKVCIGTDAGLQDVRAYEDVGGALEHHFQGLNLQTNKKYVVTVKASNAAGDVVQSSDSVTVIENNITLSGIAIRNGEDCTSVPGCDSDVSYQKSPSTYSAHWIPVLQQIQQYPDTHIGLEIKVPNSGGYDNLWNMIREYENHGLSQHVTIGGLSLEPGHTYRAAVKFCAVNVCTNPVYSDGVTVIPHPPVSKGVQVTYEEAGGQSKIDVVVDRFRDPDIQSLTDAYGVMDRYEWSLTDNSQNGNMLINWTPVSSPVVDGNKVTFTINLPKHLTFAKCHRLAVRGYNRLGLYTIVSTDIKYCKASDPLLIVPSIVIDAFGQNKKNKSDEGDVITLDENAGWHLVDADYTQYNNILSAVWPSLRHHNYSWAVVEGNTIDPVYHFKRENLMTETNPCNLPGVVKCGTTKKEFINIEFGGSKFLKHGKRYYICIHANEKAVAFEKWKPTLPEVNSCSDGITVDLTPPSPGTVTVTGLKEAKYQVSRSEVSVSWDGFTDVEESGPTPHLRGISHYKVALGSVASGEDIMAMTDVGLVTQTTVPRLTLYDGQTVYASVIATDFVNKTTRVSSTGFVIDSSPPEKTGRQIQLENRYVTSSIIFVCWEGVLRDPHSGIKYYNVSFGSRPAQTDIVPLTKVEDVCGQFDTESKLSDGHSFYISVKAVNHAGLSAVFISHAFVVDTTPPTVGHVFDGKATDAASGALDKDYITNIQDMGAHWEGFFDSNSPLKLYKVKVGRCPGCEETVAEYEAAARTDVVFIDRHIMFEEGIKYYVTVTTCNKAGLCSSATSDGVILDQTPPVPGRVMDGTQDRDIQYQASRTFLGCKWHGFEDPESGLDYYEWRVGTTRGGQDILAPTHSALEEIAFLVLPPSTLPTGRKLFITVRAYNKAGLFSESTSNGFIIDGTAPVIEKSPRIDGGHGSLVAMTLISRTTMKISWEVKDEDSFIEKQYISISSHQLGEFDSSALELPGLLREFTYTQLDLHDGSLYKVKVAACNMAGICTSADTGDILVDGSIPLTGTLAVKTDHAARLSRHQSNGMTWTRNSLNLAWLGFADLHSGIDHYIVTVGSGPFGTDLANTELPNVAPHSASGVDKEDEGVVQVFSVATKDISSRESLFVAIWAVNGVGLRSSPHHSELLLGGGGQLELVRRCVPYNCGGHCVCSVQDKNCAVSSGCTQLSGGGNNAVVTVNDVISLTSLDPATAEDVDFSPSDTFLAATWKVSTAQGLLPVRFEYSAGETEFDKPMGIYNEALDRVWFDAGTLQVAVVVLAKGKEMKLSPGLKYSVFVRAWYNDNTYSIFKSDGVLIDITRPTFTAKLGMAVRERKTPSTEKDVDFQPFTDTVHISWDGKFLPGHSGLLKYRVYVSTTPGGHNINGSDDISTTSYTATNMNLEVGTLYFSNVLAYNKAGLVGWTYSDGVLPDTVKPVTGNVQDGEDLYDIDYQSSPTNISATWFGFSDTESTIIKYFWCVGANNDTDDCSLLDWQDVGLHTTAKTKLDEPLSEGTRIWTKVYAVDVAGNQSPVAVSDGVLIDMSNPIIKDIFYLGDNLVSNPSFEDNGNTVPDPMCNDLIPTSWASGDDSCIKIVTPDAPNSKHGNSHLVLSGSIYQTVTGLEIGRTYLLTVHTGYPETLTFNHKAVEGSVSIGQEVFTFSLDPRLCKGVCQVDEQSSILWTTHKYNFVAEIESADLTVATSSRDMEVTADHISVQKVDNSGDSSTMDSQQHLTVHPVFLPHWSAVHASWHFTDEHSPITEYSWAAGTAWGGTQIQKFVSVGRHSHGSLTGLKLMHNQTLYLTITARNAAGLITVSHPDPITVDMTPPEFSLMIDGTGTIDKSDIDYQKTGDVHVTWSVGDEESGVQRCDWGIGTVPGGSDIKKFERVPTGTTTAKFNFIVVQTNTSLKVFSTVRCFNKMGRMATATTDGVTVVLVDTLPTVKGLAVLEDEVPVLYGRRNCQSASDVRLQWARDELQSTVIQITDESTTYQPVVESRYEFATVSGLQLQSLRTYHFDVFPRPIIGVTGDMTPVNITYHGQAPKISDTEIIKVIRSGNTFTLSWAGVFLSPWEDLLFAVHVGTVQGGGDILKRSLRKESKIELTLSSTYSGTIRAFITVTAADPCGYTTHFTQTFNVNL